MNIGAMHSNVLAVLLIFAPAFFSFLPPPAFCGMIRTTVTSSASILPSGQAEIRYELKNEGNEPARHLTVATFLAMEADQSGDLGDHSPGRTTSYRCILNASHLKPGNYIIAGRVHFEDGNGVPHRVYHFASLPYRNSPAPQTAEAVAVELSEPRFNLKNVLHPGSACRITLKNNTVTPVRAVLSLYLPDGFTTESPQRVYDLPGGEKKEEEIPFRLENAAVGIHPFHAVVWDEGRGVHRSQRIEKKIFVEERPVYFKAFLILAGIVLAGIAVLYLVRRKSKV